MGFFSKFTNNAKKIQNTDLLEAIIAASLLVAAADGSIEKEETDKLQKLLANNDSLSAFAPAEINRIVTKYSGILEADFRVGKLKLMKEIGDISGSPDNAEEVFVNALAIADSDGEIDDKELTILKDLGRALGVNLSTYGL